MKIFLLLFFVLALAVPTTAQKGDEAKSEWDEFRFTDYDREVAAGLREVQQLLQGRESLLQSYERSDQSAIATEREIEKLIQDQINTHKTRLAYHEAMVNFKFPESEYDELSTIDSPIFDVPPVPPIDRGRLFIEPNIEDEPPPLIPPMFRIRSLSETESGISVEIENLGDPIDALISVADSGGTIISNPYHIELSDWDYARHISFKLLSRDDKINLLIQSSTGKNYRIPLFIREPVSLPRIMAFPFEQMAKVGESVEYQIVIEGDGNDRQRYAMKISNLPNAIAWQIAKIIPRWIGSGRRLSVYRSSATTPEGQVRSVPIRNLMFSSAFNRHELVLQLTLSRDLPKRLIGKPISFTLRIGQIRESLSITPIGIGELTIDLPQVVSARIGESKRVFVSLRNIGTEIVSGIEIRPIGTTYGVTLTTGDAFSLAADEHREIPVTLTIAADVSLGERDVKLVVSSSAGSPIKADFRLDIQQRPVTFAAVASLTKPMLIIVAVLVAIYCGMKAQSWRERRKLEGVGSYALSEVGGDD